MPDQVYQRILTRFLCRGLSLNLQTDVNANGRFAALTNVRSYIEGTLQPRPGVVNLLTGAALAGGPILSLYRLNDGTPFNGGKPVLRLAACGTNLFGGAPTDVTYGAAIDTGYSGNPVQFVTATPPNSPRPYVYIGDSVAGPHKVTSDKIVTHWGIDPPVNPPTAVVDKAHFNSIEPFEAVGGWVAAGTVAGAPSLVARINTTIAKIQYDSGSSGQALVNLTSMANVGVGALLIFNGTETAIVEEVKIPIATTTVAAIAYDSGTTGLCTIQPADSLGTGQLQGQDPFTLGQRLAAAGIPAPRDHGVLTDVVPPRSTIRQIDFPVGCMITVGGELTRIVSVAVGPDGVLQSFRCSTTIQRFATDAIVGFAAIRIWLAGTFSAGQTVTEGSLTNLLTAPTASTMVGGIKHLTLTDNCSLIDGRPTMPDDEIHLTIKVDLLQNVSEVRVYLDVDSTATKFLQNYYLAVWRASDISAAIQGANAATTSLLQDARQTVVLNDEINREIANTVYAPDFARAGMIASIIAAENARARATQAESTSANATSRQLALGNNQWVELRMKVRKLILVGTDTTRTLQHVGAVEILVTASNASNLNVWYSALLLTGGYGPDVGEVGTPYVYWYRYRAPETGAVGNPSPPTRGGVSPRRQRVTLTGDTSSDAQVAIVDWFRQGSALTKATYVGSAPNGTSFLDDYGDSNVDGGETLTFDNFRPWPTVDLPRTGLCTVVGTSVVRTSGDLFNTGWSPGTPIFIRGMPYTLYASPSTTSKLSTNENIVNGTGVPFYIPGGLLQATPLSSIWSGSLQGVTYIFACRDLNNPGTLYWTTGNNPEVTTAANTLEVTSPSEPLLTGWWWDGVPFVASTENVFAINYSVGASPFHAQVTPCGRGFWTRWCWALAPEGMYFLSKDGIYLTIGGSEAESITHDDLRRLFVSEGQGNTTYYSAVDMTQVSRLKLTYSDGFLYFDYLDVNGASRTLIYERAVRRWFLDVYGPNIGPSARLYEPGALAHTLLLGGLTGKIYQFGGTKLDDGGNIAYTIVPFWTDAGDARGTKFWGDLVVDVDPAGTHTGILVTPVVNDGQTTLAATTIGVGLTGRDRYIIKVVGAGSLTTNLGIVLTGTIDGSDTGWPVFSLWESSFQPTPEPRLTWQTQALTHDLPGYLTVRDALIAYSSTTPWTLQIGYDGVVTDYAMPSSGGVYARTYVQLKALKGRSVTYGAIASTPMQLYKGDCSFRVQGWGLPGGYAVVSPIGGPSGLISSLSEIKGLLAGA